MEQPSDPSPLPVTETAPPARGAASSAPALPEYVGPFRVVELLGEGGMGTVYKAEQRTPVRRTVAVKVVKAGLGSREVLARFESERQALARMSHPNVARVLDGGADELGRPYFVMEYVPGVPITRFADANRLSIAQRLALFVQACRAIAHAHAKAVLHRDVKASNVLAYMEEGGGPVVKVIDFGIAKALTGDRLTDRTFNTDRGQVIGTYESMSPEQADGSPDIDTRTDVYSLGVLLYELLTGATPFDGPVLRKAADAEIRRIIREVDPPRPSTRLGGLGAAAGTTVAAARREQVDALARQLRSELEWIPLMAMRKERERRYASPLELAADVENYLANRPLRAAPESVAYRVRKAARRNRRAIATGAVFVALSAGAVGAYIRAINAARRELEVEQGRTLAALAEVTRQKAAAEGQRNRAMAARDDAGAVLDFLTQQVLARAQPQFIPDVRVRDQIVRAMIDPAAARVGRQFADKPLVEATVRNMIAVTLEKIGRTDLGLPHARRALQLRTAALGPDDEDTLLSENNLASMLDTMGRPAEAEPMYRDVFERRARLLGADHIDTLLSQSNYAYWLDAHGRAAEAEPLHKDALARRTRTLGPDHPETMQSMSNYAAVLETLGRRAEAEALFKRVLDRRRELLGDDHPDTLKTLNNYAFTLTGEGRAVQAEAMFQELMTRRVLVLGADHPDTIMATNNYAWSLDGVGRMAEAEPLFRRVLQQSVEQPSLGRDHPQTRVYANNLAKCLIKLSRPQEAAAVRKEYGIVVPEPKSRPASGPAK